MPDRLPIRYVCYSAPSVIGQRWEYVVRDHDRESNFMVGFEVSADEMTLAFVDVRQRWAEVCEHRLWAAIKKQSPGTYLDAKALGWVPESVTKMDRPG